MVLTSQIPSFPDKIHSRGILGNVAGVTEREIGTPEALRAAVDRYKTDGSTHNHRWVDVAGLDSMFGLQALCDKIANAIKHDPSCRKLNNFKSSCDNTSATKQEILLANGDQPLTAIAHFVMFTSLYCNEGHYIITFYTVLDLCLKKDAILQSLGKLKEYLLRRRRSQKVIMPRLPDIAEYNAKDFYKAARLCEEIYGRQPLCGYHAPVLQGYDDTEIIPDGVKTRPHRIAVRMHHIATALAGDRSLLDASLLLLIQTVKVFLQTHVDWVPYQGQIVLKQ